MGHIRLGTIPKSRRWHTVVALFAGEEDRGGGGTAVLVADVGRVADATLTAARQGLERAVEDRGLRYTFYLLTQIILAAREKRSPRGWLLAVHHCNEPGCRSDGF